MFMKTIEQERAEAEATVNGMDVVGKVRRLERSQWMYPWDDTDMDTTETLYRDSKGAYHLRVEMYHAFITSDGVEPISRREAEAWLRENVRTAFIPRYQRKRMVKRVKPFAKAWLCYADAMAECEDYVMHSESLYDVNW